MENLLGRTVNHYRFVKIIGAGSFATVFKAVLSTSIVAIKVFDLLSLSTSQIAAIKKEELIMRKLEYHKNICSLRDSFETTEHYFLVLDICELDLFDAITQQQGFPEDVTKEVFLQIIDAVEFCHANGIYHRDLKPENILISKDFRVKLTDFGLATFERHSTEYGCGSVRYMSPECMNALKKRKPYSTEKNDVWSLGILLINLLFGKNPWHEASQKDKIYQQYSNFNKRILSTQFNLSKKTEQLLNVIFESSPSKRCSLRQLRNLIVETKSFLNTNDEEDVSSTFEFNDIKEPLDAKERIIDDNHSVFDGYLPKERIIEDNHSRVFDGYLPKERIIEDNHSRVFDGYLPSPVKSQASFDDLYFTLNEDHRNPKDIDIQNCRYSRSQKKKEEILSESPDSMISSSLFESSSSSSSVYPNKRIAHSHTHYRKQSLITKQQQPKKLSINTSQIPFYNSQVSPSLTSSGELPFCSPSGPASGRKLKPLLSAKQFVKDAFESVFGWFSNEDFNPRRGAAREFNC